MKATHTPGPWEVVTETRKTKFITPGSLSIRRVGTLESIVYKLDSGTGFHMETHKADARLIAAAPDLLEVVREALMNCSIDNHGGGDDFECKFCNHARAVIKKATGQK